MLHTITHNEEFSEGNTEYKRFSVVADNVKRLLFEIDNTEQGGSAQWDDCFLSVQTSDKAILQRCPVKYLAELHQFEKGTGLISDLEAIFALNLGDGEETAEFLAKNTELYVVFEYRESDTLQFTLHAELNVNAEPSHTSYKVYNDTAFVIENCVNLSAHKSGLDEIVNTVQTRRDNETDNITLSGANCVMNCDTIGDEKITSSGYLFYDELPITTQVNTTESNVTFVAKCYSPPSEATRKLARNMMNRKLNSLSQKTLMNIQSLSRGLN